MLRTWIAPVAAAAAVLAATPGSAQRVDPTRIIDLHVNAEQHDRSLGASVVEGKRFRMTFDGIGTFEIMPLVLDQAQGTFRVTVYRGPVGAEGDDLRAVETVDVRTGVPVALRSMPSVGLVIDGVRTVEAVSVVTSSQAVRSAWRAYLAQDSCCVRCGVISACGCKVSGDCGFCCVAPCCPLPDPTSNDRFLPPARAFASLTGHCGTPIRDEERIHTSARQPGRIASSR